MKGSDIYYSIVARCCELEIDADRFSYLFHSAVLSMAPSQGATDHDIYRNYIEREAVRLGMDVWSRRAAPIADAERHNEPGAFLNPLSFYLPKDGEILNAHIDAYKNLTAITFELWEMYELKKGIRGLTAITTCLMGDIVEAVRQLHDRQPKGGKPRHWQNA